MLWQMYNIKELCMISAAKPIVVISPRCEQVQVGKLTHCKWIKGINMYIVNNTTISNINNPLVIAESQKDKKDEQTKQQTPPLSHLSV